MTIRSLILRSLRFHMRSHAGVVIGAAIASAVLTGALLVGDSMRESLRQRAIGKFGWIHFAMFSPDRLLSWNPAAVTVNSQTSTPLAVTGFFGALNVPATASRQDIGARANNVQVYGLPWFWDPQPNGQFGLIQSNSTIINAALAWQLGVRIGDDILFRCRKPSAISREIAVTPHTEQTIALRLKVAAITSPGTMGDFSLRAEQTPPLNAFVRWDELSSKLDEPNKVNLFVAGTNLGPPHFRFEKHPFLLGVESWVWHRSPGLARKLGVGYELRPRSTQQGLAFENGLLRSVASLDFLGISMHYLTNQNAAELRSSQIFLEPELAQAARAAVSDNSNRCEVLTLLANLIRNETNSTPYSMVTAAGPPYTPSDLHDDEIVINQWLADDLHAIAGTQIALSYFDPESGAALRERTNVFRVRSTVPLELPWADRTLMPAFPGIEKAQSTSDWDGGFPLTYKIRPKDEEYWKKFRGTPKAFVTLAAGQKMWGNRFGDLTAVRFLNLFGPEQVEAIRSQIWCRLNLDSFGLRFQPVREQALKGAQEAQDFGQLFTGFSLFLIIAALLLMGLLFQFGLERRAAEIGTLLALGFVPKRVRRLLLWEGGLLALIGSLTGAAGAVLYGKAMLHGLNTIWHDSIAGMTVRLHPSFGTIATGVISSIGVAVIAIWLTLRKQGNQPARELLAGHTAGQTFGGNLAKRGWPYWVSTGSLLFGVATIIWAFATAHRSDAEAFFSAACLLLIGGLCAVATWLGSLSLSSFSSSPLHLSNLAIRACARRRKRSIVTVALFATGVFLILALGVFRLDANVDAPKRSSGTGGFALLGRSTLPIVQDLNTSVGRDAFALKADSLRDAHIVQFRVHDGDEASCLNLDRPQRPRILGVNPDSLNGRFTFTGKAENWGNLKGPNANSNIPQLHYSTTPSAPRSTLHTQTFLPVPAIADANSLEWALHKKVGDTIDYTDDRGRTFQLRIVGAIANSMMQGSLIIDEAEFIKRFPNETGYRMFLIEAPARQLTEISQQLTRALQDVGLELMPAVQRLNAFNAVQNTYLGTFQILGGLGLLLGSAGLAIVLLRNMLERRGELGLLTALGFTRVRLARMTLIEHGALLAAGFGIGILAATVAVLPAITTPGRTLPIASLAVTLLAVIANGLIWTWLSTSIALRGNLLKSLRNE